MSSFEMKLPFFPNYKLENWFFYLLNLFFSKKKPNTQSVNIEKQKKMFQMEQNPKINYIEFPKVFGNDMLNESEEIDFINSLFLGRCQMKFFKTQKKIFNFG